LKRGKYQRFSTILTNQCTDVDVLSDRREVFTLFAIMVWVWVKAYHPLLRSPLNSPGTRIKGIALIFRIF
jgi:hypothetical protein